MGGTRSRNSHPTERRINGPSRTGQRNNADRAEGSRNPGRRNHEIEDDVRSPRTFGRNQNSKRHVARQLGDYPSRERASSTQARDRSHQGRQPRAATDLNFNDRTDFEDATRGLIAKPDTLTIKDAKGNVVWDLEEYKKYIGVDKPAPDTVNPSLWRNAQLNMQHGLFQVHDRIFQVRGYDLSNITFIQGDTGWIVFDPLISAETAKAASISSRSIAASGRWSRWSTAIRTSTTTAACAASWTKPT